MTRLLIDVLGWIGAASLLSAYALVSNGRLHGSGWYTRASAACRAASAFASAALDS